MINKAGLTTGLELRLAKYWFLLAYSLLLILGILSLMPAPDIGGSDKLAHFAAYALLSAWFSLLVEQRNTLWLILFGLIGYGLLLELLQSFTSYRQGDLIDAVANGLGVVFGLVFYFSPLRRILRLVDNWLSGD
jgi:VanZ family protein